MPICAECNSAQNKGQNAVHTNGAFDNWFHPYLRHASGTIQPRYDDTALAIRIDSTTPADAPCEKEGVTPCVSKPMTSTAKADGRFDKEDFVFDSASGEYKCPAGSRLIWRFSSAERGGLIHKYWSADCPRCAIRDQCTRSQYRRVARYEHEPSLEAMQKRLDLTPGIMRTRRCTVEHPFGTLKEWMGATHFLTKSLEKVRTEMSLHVLAYNMKRVMKIVGVQKLIAAVVP
jgi:hypothetical protein